MSKVKSYLFLHIGLFIFSLGFIASKLASGEPFLSFKYIVFMGLQMVTLFAYALIWQKVLKDIPLVVAYANKGITIIWGMLIGYLFFKEEITLFNLIGAIVIIIGTVIIVSGEEENV